MNASEIRKMEVVDRSDFIQREIAAQLAELIALLREVLPKDELTGRHELVVAIGRGGPGSVG